MRNLNQMCRDIITVAELAGVPYSEAHIKEALDLFRDEFTRGSVQFKVTTKPQNKRQVNFRYTVDLAPGRYPLDVAQSAGLLTNQGQETQLLAQSRENLPFAWGSADFEVGQGLVKIWHYPKPAQPLASIYQMPALPKSVVAYANFFEKYHFDAPPILGVDYQRHSMNLYFAANHEQHHTIEFVRSILQDQQFELPSDLSVRYCTKAAVIAFTFRWDSSRLERMCFYVPSFRRHSVPSLHFLLTRLAEMSPFETDTPHFQVGWSFGKSGQYMKMDVDYTGDLNKLLAQVSSNYGKDK